MPLHTNKRYYQGLASDKIAKSEIKRMQGMKHRIMICHDEIEFVVDQTKEEIEAHDKAVECLKHALGEDFDAEQLIADARPDTDTSGWPEQ